MTAAAVRADRVTKRFRRHGRGASTLKSALVDAFRAPRAADRLTDPLRFDVLRDATFEIARGETVGVIGRNGAGKTTLLRLVAKILRPDSGTIEVTGRVAALLELGAGFHPELTGRENVVVNGIVLGLSRAEIRDRMDRIAEFAEVGDHLDAPVRTYSTGLAMRLAFAVAVHVQADVLLVDEVLAVGDEGFRRKCLEAMRLLMRDGRTTTVLVSHDLDLVASVCDRVLVVEAPRVDAWDDPALGVAHLRGRLLP